MSFAHIIAVRVLHDDDHWLRLWFEDGAIVDVDVWPLISWGEAFEHIRSNRALFEEVGSWPTHPLFVQAHAEAIREAIAGFPDPSPESVRVLYSAHSIPAKLVTRDGDPYPKEVEQSVHAINAALGDRSPWTLAYQSKLGPVEWLGPATLDVIQDLGRRGEKQVLVVPIAFVTDHVETLYEVDQLFAEQARRAGIAVFRRTPGLNDRPELLRALADLALARKEFWA